MWEVTKSFRFESAHTLHRAVEADGSKRIHGHSYRAEIALRQDHLPESGMVTDLGEVKLALEDARVSLDHHLLDEIEGLGPTTMENLSRWIWDRLKPKLPALCRVTVHRDSLEEAATYFGRGEAKA